MGFLGYFRQTKPKWEVEYEFYENEIVRRSKLDKDKLKDVIKLFKEYNILPEWEEMKG